MPDRGPVATGHGGPGPAGELEPGAGVLAQVVHDPLQLGAVAGGEELPVDPGSTMSSSPPAAGATTGTPLARASWAVWQNVSWRPVWTNRSSEAKTRATSAPCTMPRNCARGRTRCRWRVAVRRRRPRGARPARRAPRGGGRAPSRGPAARRSRRGVPRAGRGPGGTPRRGTGGGTAARRRRAASARRPGTRGPRVRRTRAGWAPGCGPPSRGPGAASARPPARHPATRTGRRTRAGRSGRPPRPAPRAAREGRGLRPEDRGGGQVDDVGTEVAQRLREPPGRVGDALLGVPGQRGRGDADDGDGTVPGRARSGGDDEGLVTLGAQVLADLEHGAGHTVDLGQEGLGDDRYSHGSRVGAPRARPGHAREEVG